MDWGLQDCLGTIWRTGRPDASAVRDWFCSQLEEPFVAPDTPDRVQTTRLTLLKKTQDYMQALVESQAPDSVLAEAWQEFYRVYNSLIERFAVSQGVRGADVDDCVQEVWREVATRLSGFQRPDSRPGLRAWLYKVVRSKSTDLLRRRSRQPATSLDKQMEAGHEPLDSNCDPAASLDREWEDAMLETLLADLRTRVSELNYQVLEMRSVKQRSVSEVARALELTPEQVRYRHHRMLRKLQARVTVYTGKPFGAEG